MDNTDNNYSGWEKLTAEQLHKSLAMTLFSSGEDFWAIDGERSMSGKDGKQKNLYWPADASEGDLGTKFESNESAVSYVIFDRLENEIARFRYEFGGELTLICSDEYIKRFMYLLTKLKQKVDWHYRVGSRFNNARGTVPWPPE